MHQAASSVCNGHAFVSGGVWVFWLAQPRKPSISGVPFDACNPWMSGQAVMEEESSTALGLQTLKRSILQDGCAEWKLVEGVWPSAVALSRGRVVLGSGRYLSQLFRSPGGLELSQLFGPQVLKKMLGLAEIPKLSPPHPLSDIYHQ